MLRVDKASTRELKDVMRQLRRIAPAVAKHLQKEFRAAAQRVAEDARQRQTSRSGNLRKQTRAGVRTGQPEVRSKAAYSRVREYGGRVPLFGDRDQWVYQEPQPSIFPAVRDGRDDYIKDANVALFRAVKEAGFK